MLDDRRNIELVPGRDSATLVFALRPIAVTSLAAVQVTDRTKSMHSEHWIENSSMVRRVKLTSSPASIQPNSQTITSTRIEEAVTFDATEMLPDDSIKDSISTPASGSMNPESPSPVISERIDLPVETHSANLFKVAAVVLPVLLLGFFIVSSFWSCASKGELQPDNQRSSIEFTVEEIREMNKIPRLSLGIPGPPIRFKTAGVAYIAHDFMWLTNSDMLGSKSPSEKSIHLHFFRCNATKKSCGKC